MNCCALFEKKRAWKCAKILLDNDATDEYCIYIIVVYRVNEKYFRERATYGSKIGGYINLLGEYLSIAKVYRCFIHSKLLASGKSHLILQAASLNGVWFHSFIVWERWEQSCYEWKWETERSSNFNVHCLAIDLHRAEKAKEKSEYNG